MVTCAVAVPLVPLALLLGVDDSAEAAVVVATAGVVVRVALPAVTALSMVPGCRGGERESVCVLCEVERCCLVCSRSATGRKEKESVESQQVDLAKGAAVEERGGRGTRRDDGRSRRAEQSRDSGNQAKAGERQEDLMMAKGPGAGGWVCAFYCSDRLFVCPKLLLLLLLHLIRRAVSK